MLEDILEYDGITISEYIIEMWKHFYENNSQWHSLPVILEKKFLNYKIN